MKQKCYKCKKFEDGIIRKMLNTATPQWVCICIPCELAEK